MLIEYLSRKNIEDRNIFIGIFFGFSILYFIWSALFVQTRVDHILFYSFIASMYLLHRNTRKLVMAFVFFILFWVIYDSLRVYPNYLFNEVHILQPYNFEKWLFGLHANGSIVTPNEYFKIHHSTFFDVLSAIFYLTWVPVPIALAIYFFIKDKSMMLRFTSCYLLTNIVGFIIYYVYPAAPPWYVDLYGSQFSLEVPANAAGLINFDNIIDYPLFQNIYTKNSNVFAAIPSLHAAYPVVAWYYARMAAPKWMSTIIFIDILGIWFSAVYSFHHYVIDVLIGALVAIFSIYIFEKLVLKTVFSKFIANFALFINK